MKQPARHTSIRRRLGMATCLLLASSGATAANAQTTDRWQFDASGLLYGERSRIIVVEPTARITRLFKDGQTLSATLGIDTVTGSTPNGGIVSTEIQTTTTASGHTKTEAVGTVPTSDFRDLRGVLDLNWMKPTGGWLTTSLGTHASYEKDYRSLGANAKLSLDFMHHLTTLTLGGGYNRDGVSPAGGTRAPFTDGTEILGTGTNSKDVSTYLVGLSRVLTRRWLVAANYSRSNERGYLTDPYKILSVVDAVTGDPLSTLTESRPSSRNRQDVLLSSVYHLEHDIFYVSDRVYWDDWGVHSNMIDLKYRRQLPHLAFLEPHVRFYFQGRANFFRYSLPQGSTLPEYATADYRLGDLRTGTLGLTYSFHIPSDPGTWSVRGEYLRQWGKGFPSEAIGKQRSIDLAPPVDIGSIAFAYSRKF